MKEMWKDIPGYERLYQVSNLGNVRSLNYNRTGEIKLLKQSTNKHEYKLVSLCKNGKTKTCKVHRLVAIAFIPNPNNLPIINHKDEDKTNNNVNNLEWCTYEYNVNYGTRNERTGESHKGKSFSEEHKKKISEKIRGEKHPNYGKKGKDSSNAKAILMYDKEGNFIKRFECIVDANEYLGKGRYCSSISMCLTGRRKTAYGYVFRYADEKE